MDEKFWHRRWETNDIGFHKSEPHHDLVRFFGRLQAKPGDTVFVPLCGKSPDMVWLREQGLEVVGVDLSRIAVDAFFAENGLRGGWSTLNGLPCCRADGFAIYCGDIYALEAGALQSVTALYDRGALVALPPEMRDRYARHLANLLPPGAHMLLISYEYDQIKTHGPPFSVPVPAIEALFGSQFELEVLVEEDVLWSHQGMAARGVTRLIEFAVLLTKR